MCQLPYYPIASFVELEFIQCQNHNKSNIIKYANGQPLWAVSDISKIEKIILKDPNKKKLVIEIGDTEQNEPGIEPEEEDNLLNPINERVLGEQN